MDAIRNFEWDGILRVFRREKELDPQGIASHGGRSKRFSAGDEHTTRDYVVRGAQLFFLLIALFINVAIAGMRAGLARTWKAQAVMQSFRKTRRSDRRP
jgi:hypothetical protein